MSKRKLDTSPTTITPKKLRHPSETKIGSELPGKCSPSHYSALIKTAFDDSPIDLDQSSRVNTYYYFFTLFADFSQKELIKHVKELSEGRRELINHIHTDLTRNQYLGEQLLSAFQRLIESHRISAARDEFIFDLVISLSRSLDKSVRSRLFDAYLSNLAAYLRAHHESSRAKWMHSSAVARSPLARFVTRVNKHDELTDDDSAAANSERFVDNLIELTVRVLDSYGVEMNEFARDPKSINESFTTFARDLLALLFKGSKFARERIVNELVNKCLETNNKRAVYIAQLEMLLNNEFGLKYFSTLSYLEERKKLNTSVIELLTGGFTIHTKKKRSHSSIDRVDLFGMKDVIASRRLLYALRLFFYTSDKSKIDQFTVFVDFLEQHCSCASNRDEEACKMSEAAITCAVTLLRALNAKPSQDKSVVPESFKQLRQLALNDNQAPSKQILKLLKKYLPGQSASAKSVVYQSLYTVLKSNFVLTEDICELLVHQLDAHIVTDKGMTFFDLSKCLCEEEKSCEGSKSLTITEPADVLFHCAFLCVNRSMSSSRIVLTRNLARLKFAIDSIANYYASTDSIKIYDVYKAQLLTKMRKSSTSQWSPAFFKAIHQLELGFYDVVIEKLIVSNQYSRLVKMYEKYEATSTLISADIENLVCEAMSQQKSQFEETTVGHKRKHDGTIKAAVDKENIVGGVGRALKRFRSAMVQQKDKENEPPSKVPIYERLSSLRPTKSRQERSALSIQHPNRATTKTTTTTTSHENQQQITEKKSPSATLSQPLTKTSSNSSTNKRTVSELGSFANIQFEHTHRISNTAMLRMLTIYLGSSTQYPFTINPSSSSTSSASMIPLNLLSDINTIASSDRFADYLMKLVEAKIKLYDVSNDLCDTDKSYDPISFTPLKTFKMLSMMWMSLFNRITGSDGAKTLLKPDHMQSFCPRYVTRTYKMISFCRSIWTIVSERFPSLRIYLHNIESYNRSMSSSCSHEATKIERKEGDILTKEIIFLMKTLKSHIPNRSITTPTVSTKCCANILGLILDIMRSIELSPIVYANFNAWFMALAEDQIAANEDVGKAIVELLVHIGRKHDSPLINIKYLALELLKFTNDNGDSTEPPSMGEFQLRLFRQSSNQLEYQKLFVASIESTINDCKCVIERLVNLDKELGQRSSTRLVHKLIEQMIHTIAFLLHSASNIQSTELILDLMIKFYDFMAFYTQSPLVFELDYQQAYELKQLIRFISAHLQTNLSTELNRIRALIIQQEQLDSKKANTDDLINIIKFKQIITKLVSSIDIFEQNLKLLSSSYQNIVNLLESYQVFISSLEINFDAKVTRTVSANQLNNFLLIDVF